MHFKKGFTLAEMLIVLMILGVMGALTLPSVMKGVQSALYKTAYRRAYHNLSNIVAAEKIAGTVSMVPNHDNANKFFDILVADLSAQSYALASSTSGITLGSKYVPSISDRYVRSSPIIFERKYEHWITAADGSAYLITKGHQDGITCGTKSQIENFQSTQTSGADPTSTVGVWNTKDTLASNSCFVVYIDVNGIFSGPNSVANNYISPDTNIPLIEYDTFPIYIGSDGVTAGSQATTVTGRINADMK